jgi:hypothetical protein
MNNSDGLDLNTAVALLFIRLAESFNSSHKQMQVADKRAHAYQQRNDKGSANRKKLANASIVQAPFILFLNIHSTQQMGLINNLIKIRCGRYPNTGWNN